MGERANERVATLAARYAVLGTLAVNRAARYGQPCRGRAACHGRAKQRRAAPGREPRCTGPPRAAAQACSEQAVRRDTDAMAACQAGTVRNAARGGERVGRAGARARRAGSPWPRQPSSSRAPEARRPSSRPWAARTGRGRTGEPGPRVPEPRAARRPPAPGPTASGGAARDAGVAPDAMAELRSRAREAGRGGTREEKEAGLTAGRGRADGRVDGGFGRRE
jgi:hypothetical protein